MNTLSSDHWRQVVSGGAATVTSCNSRPPHLSYNAFCSGSRTITLAVVVHFSVQVPCETSLHFLARRVRRGVGG